MNVNDWWYSRRSKKYGPVELSKLRQLIQQNKIDLGTMVWQEGMSDWQPLGDVDKLNELKNTMPPALPSKAIQYSHSKPLDSRWLRFFARIFDLWWETSLLSFLSVAVLANCSFSFVELIVKPAGLQILLFLLLPVAFILDALLYRSVGNTPGKFLLGLKVTTPNGCSLSLMQYLKRNFSIWIKGVALGLPFIQLFTMANQGSRLSKGKETSYDESMNTQVRTKPVHWIRKILFIIAFTLLIFITIVFNNVWSKIVMNSFALNPISESSFEPFEPGQPWSDVTSQDKYKTLSAASKKETAQRYFNNVVVPQIPPEKCPNLCKVTANQFAAYAGFDIKYEPRVVDSIAKPNLFDQFDRNHK